MCFGIWPYVHIVKHLRHHAAHVQGNKVLAKNRNDAACISALAALMSSCLAKLLHEPPQGSYALNYRRSGGDIDTADALCEVLLFPVIRSTYRCGSTGNICLNKQEDKLAMRKALMQIQRMVARILLLYML
jgi:hypothetical protein